MIKIAKQTGLAPEEVINQASKFFGKGAGLLAGETKLSLSFELKIFPIEIFDLTRN